jgi:TetR/AcrR family transcriptional regulator
MTKRQPNHKEDIILAAARKRFAYYGFSKVTMDEIAADVGLAKPSLYYYFPAKEDLFRAVIGHEHDEFLRHMHAVLKQNVPASQKLRLYIDKRFHLFREFVNLSALRISSSIDLRTMPIDLFDNFEQKECTLVQKILRTGKASGEFLLSDPHQAATLLLHVQRGLRLRTLRTAPESRVGNEMYNELKKEMRLFIKLFLNGIRRPPAL